MDALKRHWTSGKLDNFVFQIAADFALQLEKRLEIGPVSNRELADRLKVTAGRVSQVLNNPGNFKLRSMTEYARALGMKVAVVAYDDNDPKNLKGPVNSEIFYRCWKLMGSPADFYELSTVSVFGTYFAPGRGSAANTGFSLEPTTALEVQKQAPAKEVQIH
jgi:hypothetical protein